MYRRGRGSIKVRPMSMERGLTRSIVVVVDKLPGREGDEDDMCVEGQVDGVVRKEAIRVVSVLLLFLLVFLESILSPSPKYLSALSVAHSNPLPRPLILRIHTHTHTGIPPHISLKIAYTPVRLGVKSFHLPYAELERVVSVELCAESMSGGDISSHF